MAGIRKEELDKHERTIRDLAGELSEAMARIKLLEATVDALNARAALNSKKLTDAHICAVYLAGLLDTVDPEAQTYHIGRELVAAWKASKDA